MSLEDDLMGIFGSERMDSMLQNLGLKEGEAIRPWIDNALARAQHKVEALNYDIRKQLLKYDDVMNEPRTIACEQCSETTSAPTPSLHPANDDEPPQRAGYRPPRPWQYSRHGWDGGNPTAAG